ncbi:MAG: hypothetical protein ACUVRD_00720 [Bacteroidia bacterium]
MLLRAQSLFETKDPRFEKGPLEWRPRWGASWGIGGIHLWARPTVDFHVARACFRLSPVPGYLSLGASYRVGFFQHRQRKDRPVYVTLVLHQAYLPWGEKRSFPFRLQFLLGGRSYLERLERLYLEMGIGIQVTDLKTRRYWTPMGEVRLGGVYRSHTYKPKRLRKVY